MLPTMSPAARRPINRMEGLGGTPPHPFPLPPHSLPAPRIYELPEVRGRLRSKTSLSKTHRGTCPPVGVLTPMAQTQHPTSVQAAPVWVGATPSPPSPGVHSHSDRPTSCLPHLHRCSPSLLVMCHLHTRTSPNALPQPLPPLDMSTRWVPPKRSQGRAGTRASSAPVGSLFSNPQVAHLRDGPLQPPLRVSEPESQNGRQLPRTLCPYRRGHFYNVGATSLCKHMQPSQSQGSMETPSD